MRDRLLFACSLGTLATGLALAVPTTDVARAVAAADRAPHRRPWTAASAARYPGLDLRTLVAVRCAWSVDDARTESVCRWLRQRGALDRRLLDGIDRRETDGDAGRVAALQRFNAGSDACRQSLVDDLGADDAARVLAEFWLFRIDVVTGLRYRVRIDGSPARPAPVATPAVAAPVQ